MSQPHHIQSSWRLLFLKQVKILEHVHEIHHIPLDQWKDWDQQVINSVQLQLVFTMLWLDMDQILTLLNAIPSSESNHSFHVILMKHDLVHLLTSSWQLFSRHAISFHVGKFSKFQQSPNAIVSRQDPEKPMWMMLISLDACE